MNKKKRYTVTAALPYANGPIHIGHLAGAYLPADIFFRFLKMNEHEAVFVCGSDEHGAAITLRAKKEGVSPQEIVDKYHKINKETFEKFGIDFSVYHRTSSKLHHQTAQEFFLALYKKGAFEKKTTRQFYDEEHQQFLADRYITGTCPKCGYENAYGDQCEKCGTGLSPEELINPKSTLSGKTPVLKETSHYYLPMQKHEKWLKEWIEKGILDGKIHHDPQKWRKHVLGQCKSWLDAGLKPRAMTRDLEWGVKVPLKGEEGKVLYVWLDAPIGYISATKQWAADNNSRWEPFWQDEQTQLIHFIGKDNIVFHCIIFPILLKEHGGFNLPVNVPANEFLNLEGQKISTSRNWAVWLHEYLKDFPGKQDELRYVLCSIAPETKDSEFTWKDFQTRVNSELVGILGNFVNRACVLTHKYYQGKIPEVALTAEHENILIEVNQSVKKISDFLYDFKFKDALQEMMNIARTGNKFLADTEPWKLQKTNPEAVKSILKTALLITAKLSVASAPFLPHTSQKIQKILNISPVKWDDIYQFKFNENQVINKPELLFEKIENSVIEQQINKLKNMSTASSQPPIEHKPEINFEDFTKLEIRTGKIIEAEKHPNADKLLVLKLDIGGEQRTIVSGIAQHYKPEEIIGKNVSVLLNLKPRKLRGIESQGMILMAEDSNGNLAFIVPEKDLPSGSEIR
ncbi:MAG: methionine--tRNA ligase [Bacteroidetes bacterium]|nr:MAG: methionine--tRNA ligase [Bacteroidota bacterium]